MRDDFVQNALSDAPDADSARERPLTAQDVMALINKTRQRGFALRDLVQASPDATFQSVDLIKHNDASFADLPQDDLQSDDRPAHSDAPEMDDLANLVAHRQSQATQSAQNDGLGPSDDTAAMSDLAQAFEQTQSESAPMDPETAQTEAPQPQTDQASYDAGHEAGFSEGFAQGHQAGIEKAQTEIQEQSRQEIADELEAEKFAALNNTLSVLNILVAELTNVLDDETTDLSDQLTQTVYSLVSERVGQHIDSHPQDFIDKIETLADRITSTVADCTIRVAPQDYDIIQSQADQSEFASLAKFVSDDTLTRGDVKIRAGNIRFWSMS